VEGEQICVVLGDNLIENNILGAKQAFEKQTKGAQILLKEVPDPERFGCPEISNGRILSIEEKPKIPKSKYAVTGIYFYDASVFEKIGRAKPSWRNELEITDVNNMYLQENTLSHSFLDGWWTDAGTFESLVRATNLVVKTGANKIPGRGAPPRHVRAAE